jgi:hypothetical protein
MEWNTCVGMTVCFLLLRNLLGKSDSSENSYLLIDNEKYYP